MNEGIILQNGQAFVERWTSRKITVWKIDRTTGKDVDPTEMDADCFGSLALVKPWQDDAQAKFSGRLGIVSLHTSDRFAAVTSGMVARRMVELLCRECKEAVNQRTKAAIILALPSWVRPWLKSCETKDWWVDPAEFKRQHREVIA